MRKGICILTLLMLALGARAQYAVYSLNRYTPLYINPAAPTLDHNASLSFFHDEFTVSSGEYLTTNAFNAEYPFIKKESGRKILGLGLSFLQKDASTSDLLKTYEAGLSVATPIQLTERHSLHYGMSANYVNKRTSLEQLSTGSQWIAGEFRYDPNAGLGESFEVQNLSYFTVSAGLVWSFVKEQKQHTSVGLSVWNLNQPNESFFSATAKLPMTYMVYGETVLYENHRVDLVPSFYYQRTEKWNSYTALWTTRLKFRNENPYDLIKTGSVDLIARYDFNQDLSLGFALTQPGFSAGFSYNFPLVSDNKYFQSGIQIGVSLSKTLWKPQPQKILVESVPVKRQFDFERQEEHIVKEPSEVDKIKSQLEALDDVKSLQFELNKDFRFAFGKAELEESTASFLDELVVLLQDNPGFDLRIVGHTDNVGTKNANYDLSVQRAQAVADYLLERGVPEEQIEVIGRGDTEPIVANTTEEEKAKNRRVQFIITVNR